VGIYPEERREKQDVNINITLYADLSRAGQSDDLADTVNYKAVKKEILAMVEESSCLLVERLAERIAEICLSHRGVEAARVLVEKPGALRFARTVGVEIFRERKP
jgi:FolB domain-containing protein